MEHLSQRLQNLPQELFDKIHDLVFQNANSVSIGRAYKPPSNLQVDRQSRSALISDYFCKTEFYSDDGNLLAKWLFSLQPEHVELLTDVVFNIYIPFRHRHDAKTLRNQLNLNFLCRH